MGKTSGARRKVTFTLPAPLVAEVKALVDEGQAPSQSAFVVAALSRQVRQVREERLREEFRAAAADPLFLRDLEETMDAFRAADGETVQMIPD